MMWSSFDKWIDKVYFGNSLLQYLQAAFVFSCVVAGALVLQAVVIGRLRAWAQKTVTDFDDFLVEVLSRVRSPEFYLAAFYVATKPLVLPVWLSRGFRVVVLAAVTYRVLRILQSVVEYSIGKVVGGGREATASERYARRNLSYVANGGLWVLAVLFLLHNFGFHIESIIAGLGVGGIAVALAAQAVLGDLFSALAILLDKPFVVGDAIALDKEWQGVVERIGVKTTRVRAPSGEILVIPNSVLTSSKLKNFRHLEERRVSFNLGLARDTPREKLAGVKKLIEAAVRGQKDVRFDRAHFVGIGASSLDFEIVYFVLDSNYAKHLDINEAVLTAVLDGLKKEGAGLAYPTQLVLQAPSPA